MMRWICIGLGVLGFAVAYRVSGGNLLASLSLALTPITLLVVIERALRTARERNTGSFTDPQFMVQKAGGAEKLRHQALLIRLCCYMLIAVAVPMLVVGAAVATQGNITAFFIALGAAFVLFGARFSLSAASKMFAAAEGAL